MKPAIRFLVIAGLLISIGACSKEPVEETVWDDQIKALDKARDVEEKLMQRVDDLAEELENKDEEEPPR
ncbi:MAG: hypothetical protein OER80_05795 [Gammaproteobacteria bacterium]|nr:hypothetical protein [Gammaproteobacteria bacterium]MDH3769201.1 hypothetical protein [Gammaproteobacteria bacterium]